MRALYPEFTRVTDMHTERYSSVLHRHYIYRDAGEYVVGCMMVRGPGRIEANRAEQRFAHQHLANTEFESNIFQDEERGMEPAEGRENIAIQCLTADQLPLEHPALCSFGTNYHDLKRSGAALTMQKVYSGMRVVVVCDPLFQFRAYPISHAGDAAFEIPLRDRTRVFLESQLFAARQYATGVFEGYYSDVLGIALTDLFSLNGELVTDKPFEQRAGLLSGFFGDSSKTLFDDHYEAPRAVIDTEVARSSWRDSNAPAYLLRSSADGQAYLFSESNADDVSLTIKQNGNAEFMELGGNYTVRPGRSPISSYRFNMQLCAAAAFYPFSNREPLLLTK